MVFKCINNNKHFSPRLMDRPLLPLERTNEQQRYVLEQSKSHLLAAQVKVQQ